DYIRFAEIGRAQNELDKKNKKPTYLNLNMNIEATPNADVFIILDNNTGEQIIARGNGDISLKVDLGNSVEMFGSYVISEGKYLFNFRGLLQKDFIIDESSKITWSGDPLKATLDVQALYNLPNPLPLYPLVSAQMEGLDNSDPDKVEAKKPYKTQIALKLNGSLAQPDIKFDILQPDNKSAGTPAYIKFEQIKNVENELVSQAGVLLLLGNFKSADGISGSTYGQGAVSSVSDMISSAVSSEITNQFQNITGIKNISIGVNYRNINSGGAENALSRDQFSVNVSANLWKDRVVVDFGNSIDVGKNASGNNTSNLIGGDFKAQFLISKDGRLRLNAYRTNNMDVEGENFTKGGVGLSYKKVFNNFNDLFFPRRRKNLVSTDTLKTES
ncbi:MAG: translocation/assembly module TamB domain-containing protein, partial [Chitinophagaceae bacterium]|nr:translocation/assembly module TamB domain-containing protein [Chitinophagaceae bacterium]